MKLYILISAHFHLRQISQWLDLIMKYNISDILFFKGCHQGEILYVTLPLLSVLYFLQSGTIFNVKLHVLPQGGHEEYFKDLKDCTQKRHCQNMNLGWYSCKTFVAWISYRWPGFRWGIFFFSSIVKLPNPEHAT